MSQTLPPAPLNPAFMPLSIGQILERIFKLFRVNLLPFLRIACVPAMFFFVIYALAGLAMFGSGVLKRTGHPPDPATIMAVLIPVGLISALAFMVVYVMFEVAGTYAALQADAAFQTGTGTTVSFHAAYRFAFRDAGRFLWLMVLRHLWIGLPILVSYGTIAGLALLLFAKGVNPQPWVYFLTLPLLFLLYLGSLAYAAIMGLRLSLALPACVAEGLPAAPSLKRSLALTKGAMGRIFVVLLAVYAVGYVAFMVFEMLCFGAVAGVIFGAAAMHVRQWGPFTAISMIVLMICIVGAMCLWIAALATGYCISFAVLYHDQRLRLEGAPPATPAGEPV